MIIVERISRLLNTFLIVKYMPLLNKKIYIYVKYNLYIQYNNLYLKPNKNFSFHTSWFIKYTCNIIIYVIIIILLNIIYVYNITIYILETKQELFVPNISICSKLDRTSRHDVNKISNCLHSRKVPVHFHYTIITRSRLPSTYPDLFQSNRKLKNVSSNAPWNIHKRFLSAMYNIIYVPNFQDRADRAENFFQRTHIHTHTHTHTDGKNKEKKRKEKPR